MGTNLPDFFLLSGSVAVAGRGWEGKDERMLRHRDTLRAAGPMEAGLQVLL